MNEPTGTMEETMNQPTGRMEETLTCTTDASLIATMSITQEEQPRPTPMLHQPTPQDDEDADIKKSDNEESQREPTTLVGKTKLDEQLRFIKNTTLEDVLVDEENAIQVGRKANDTTYLQSIKGLGSRKLSTICLRKFCSVHHISGYKNKPKTILCNLIVERMKTMGLDTKMYPGDYEEKSDKNSDTTRDKSSKKDKKLSRNAKPPAVVQEGCYWRAIGTFFLESLRPHVIKLGNNPDIQKIDSRNFLHEDIWNIIAVEYNNQAHPDLKTFDKNDTFYEASNVPEDVPSHFNKLTPRELSQLMAHINDHYKQAVRKQRTSGNHFPITKYIGARPWLLLYNKSLQESSIEMKAFVSGNLPDGVGGSSLKKRDKYETDSDDEEKNKSKRRRNRSQGGKPDTEKLRVARAMEVFGEVRTSFKKSFHLFLLYYS